MSSESAIDLDRIGQFNTWPDAALAAQARVLELEKALHSTIDIAQGYLETMDWRTSEKLRELRAICEKPASQ